MAYLEIALAALIGVLSVARLTRLVTQDTYPPVAWLRGKWDQINEKTVTRDGATFKIPGPWTDMLHCPYCFSTWAAIPVLAWALLSDLSPAWWIVNGWLAGIYVAAMIVVRDGE